MADTTQAKLSRLRKRMADTNTDLVALGPSGHMQWLLKLNPHGDERPVMALITADHIGVLMPMLNAAASRQQTDVALFEWSDADGPQAALNDILAAGHANSPGLSVVLDETMRTDFAFLLLDSLKNPTHRYTQDTVGALRLEKDHDEYLALRESARLNDGAFQAAFAAVRTGMRERDLRDIVVEYYKSNGAEPAFCTVAFGKNSAFPHHHTGEDTLHPGMAILIDAGCRLNGYPSDMTRCAWYGGPPCPEFEKVANIVEQAVQSALSIAKPGVLCSNVDQAARKVITKAGYGEAFSHRTGHGLGVDGHEPPYIAANYHEPLVASTVFTIEPGIYLEDQFGIRLEDTVYLHEDHVEILSALPRTVPCIPIED
ncbi:MAG: M24 family metallopeptidase [Litoreibacter sp.]